MMLKFVFIITMFFNRTSFADCPELSLSQDESKWHLMDSSITCRSSCKKSEDCDSFQDSCGRVLLVNKQYSSDVQKKIASEKTNGCNNKLTEYKKESLTCIQEQCAIVKGDCKQAKLQQIEYIAKTFSSECRDDNECSFIVKIDDKCIEHLPLNNRIDISNHKLNLEYLSDKVSLSCGRLAKKRCDSKRVTQCFLNRCINVNKKIEYLNYINLEDEKNKKDKSLKPMPMVLSNIDEITCSRRSDCKSVLGVCGQSIIAVNFKKMESLQKRIKDVESKLVCPKAGKFYLRKPECHESLCLFK